MQGSGSQHFNPFPNQPTSPPVTPISQSQSQPRFPSAASHTSPTYKRVYSNALFGQAQSPPLEHIEPIGQGHHFNYTRPQTNDPSSRPSSASGAARASSPEPSDAGSQLSEFGKGRQIPRRVVPGELILEELASNASAYASDIEVLRPDHTEEASSERGRDERDDLADDLGRVNCASDDNDDAEGEQVQRSRRRTKKRWSGFQKRSHSQSVGSHSDNDDAEALDAHDVGSSARRLRRRVRGPGDRSSLTFEEIPNYNIPEDEEPPEEDPRRQPLLSSDGEILPSLEALPFWVLEDPMIVDSDSSQGTGA